MAYEGILYDEKLKVDRDNSTWIARRTVAHWAGRGWLTFNASTGLASMRPDNPALRALIATVFSRQKGFESFDKNKFAIAWKASVEKGSGTVQMVYDSAWAGLKP